MKKNHFNRKIAALLATLLMMSMLTVGAGALSPAPIDPPEPPQPELIGCEDVFGMSEPVKVSTPIIVPTQPEPSHPGPCLDCASHFGLTNGNEPVTGEPPLEEMTGEPPLPETIEGASTVTPNGITVMTTPNEYHYWTETILDPTPIIREDPATNTRYLCFKLANINKLEALYNEHSAAFRIKQNLRLVNKMNEGQAVIWETGNWYENIGDCLNATTKQYLMTSQLDGIQALKYIEGTLDYRYDNGLQTYVDYELHCINYYLDQIERGLSQLQINGSTIPGRNADDPSGYLAKVRLWVANHPEIDALDDVWTTYTSMPTSRFIDMQSLGAERVNEMYAGVRHVAEIYWPYSLNGLESYSYAIPLSTSSNPSWLNLGD